VFSLHLQATLTGYTDNILVQLSSYSAISFLLVIFLGMIGNSFQKKFSYAMLIEQCRINHNFMESSHIFIMRKCVTKELTKKDNTKQGLFGSSS